MARGDEERAAGVRAAMRRVSSFQEPTIAPTWADIQASAEAWRGRLK